MTSDQVEVDHHRLTMGDDQGEVVPRGGAERPGLVREVLVRTRESRQPDLDRVRIRTELETPGQNMTVKAACRIASLIVHVRTPAAKPASCR